MDKIKEEVKTFLLRTTCVFFSGEKSYVSFPLNLNTPPKDHLQANNTSDLEQTMSRSSLLPQVIKYMTIFQEIVSHLEQALKICLPDRSLCPSQSD